MARAFRDKVDLAVGDLLGMAITTRRRAAKFGLPLWDEYESYSCLD